MTRRNYCFFALVVIVCAVPSIAAFQAPAAPSPQPGEACALIPEAGAPIETVALGERVDPANAPRPSNESERLLFRQLYETLVRVDCRGEPAAGLGTSWRLDPNGVAWLITLRDNARFADGATVTAADVVSGWTVGGVDTELRPEVRRLVRSAVALDDRTLEITLQGPQQETPIALAHTDLAIAKHAPGSPWPIGTRSTRIAPGAGTPRATGRSEVTVLRLPAAGAPSDAANNPPSIRFLVSPGRDARDLMDEGVDLVVTRDPTALEYAATLPRFVPVPLGWQKVYALVTPGRSRESRLLSAKEREDLAHDAVRGEARGSVEPFWWQALDCGIAGTQPGAPASAPTPRVVYDGNDDVARNLAERLVGLVRASGPGAATMLEALLPDRPRRTFQRAAGLTGAALTQAARSGNDAAYIVALERRPLIPCRDMTILADTMGWVDPQTIVPLVDTRLQAIVRRGRSGVTVEGDGGLLLTGPER